MTLSMLAPTTQHFKLKTQLWK